MNKKKKKYEKPKVTSEKIFETHALGCGKCITGLPIRILPQCNAPPMRS
ncbi:MAG: hypothetical protein JW983_03740 [Elusimicrobia bacterium]|nr:hypothetical protein [Elusimicrobiota bacterium]